MQNYSPLQNSQTNFAELQKIFFETDIVASDAFAPIKKDLIDYFNSADASARKIYRQFWLLHVYASWKFINRLSPTEVIDFMVEQIPDAIRLGFDLVDKLVWYMGLNVQDLENRVIFYSEIRTKILAGQFFVDSAGKEMTMQDLFQQIRLLSSFANDAMRAAELYEKIQRTLFAGTENDSIYEYLIIDRREAVERMVDLVDFINTVDTDNIWEAVEGVLFIDTTQTSPDEVPALVVEKPEIIRPTPELEMKAKELMAKMEPAASGKPVEKLPQAEPAKQAMPQKSAEPVKPAQPPKPAVTVKPSYAEIRKKIEAVFPKNAQGEYINLDSVLAALQSAAEKYNDPKISELMYFDESDSKFKWSV